MQNMESLNKLKENLSTVDSIVIVPAIDESQANKFQYPIPRPERAVANFVCRLCLKTFYNENALHNHKKTQHDEDTSEGELPPNGGLHVEDINANGSFTFIPLNTNAEIEQTVRDGLTTRVFSEDTTYLIIKMEEDLESDSLKRSRLNHVIRKTQMKPKQSVDLRGPFTCTFPSTMRPDLQCRQIFFNCCDYSLHYREMHTKRRKAALRCQVCEKRLDRDGFSAENNAVQQPPRNALILSNQVTFSCHSCAQTFLNSAEYDKHNRIVHAKMKPFQCSICTKRFTQQGGLQQHMRMHTGIRPFVCTYCPKAFTQKAGLDQHLRTHTKVKPFTCIICSKSFSQSVHLRQHMRTHTNIQPFECPVCGRKFKQSSHLNFHMRSHLGDGTLIVEHYGHAVQPENQMEFLSLANLQPVQDGETLYYAAELAAPTNTQNAYVYPSEVIVPDMLTL